MRQRPDIQVESPPAWLEAVLADFDSFLIDHADGERKASAFALGLVAKYPMLTKIIPPLIDISVEELEHFQQVYTLLHARGLQLPIKIVKDRYILELNRLCRADRMERLMDRLIIGAVAEARGLERFKLVAEALEDPELKRFYKRLWASEAKHSGAFLDLAAAYFDRDEVWTRAQWFMEREAEILLNLPIRPALH